MQNLFDMKTQSIRSNIMRMNDLLKSIDRISPAKFNKPDTLSKSNSGFTINIDKIINKSIEMFKANEADCKLKSKRRYRVVRDTELSLPTLDRQRSKKLIADKSLKQQ